MDSLAGHAGSVRLLWNGDRGGTANPFDAHGPGRVLDGGGLLMACYLGYTTYLIATMVGQPAT